MAKTIDLELTRAEVEVRELEARLRVVPMNDNQLLEALQLALASKQERLDKLRALHASANRKAAKLAAAATKSTAEPPARARPLRPSPVRKPAPAPPKAKSGK